MSNTTKVWIFLIFSSLVLIFAGYAIAQRLGLFIGLLAAVVFHLALWFWGTQRILKEFNYRKLVGQDAWGFQKQIDAFAKQTGIKTPDVYLVDTEARLTMVLSFSYKAPSLAVSENILDQMNEQERKALAALFVVYVKDRGSAFKLLTQQIFSMFNEFGHFLDSINPIRFIFARIVPIFEVFTYQISFFFLKMIYSKSRYFALDENAAKLAQSHEDVAQVIRKLSAWIQCRQPKLQYCTDYLFLIEPRSEDTAKWKKFHLPASERIKKLIGYYPI